MEIELPLLYDAIGFVAIFGFLLVLPGRINSIIQTGCLKQARPQLHSYYQVRMKRFIGCIFAERIGAEGEVYGQLEIFPPEGVTLKVHLTPVDAIIDITIFGPGNVVATETLRNLVTEGAGFPVRPTSVRVPAYARHT